METDGFDLPRYVNSASHTNYMYQQQQQSTPTDQQQQQHPLPPIPPSNRQHTRISSILSESTSTHPSEPPSNGSLQRAVSLNNSFYSSSLGGYREDSHSSAMYNPSHDYSPYAPPRRANTHRENASAIGGPTRGTLSPKSDNRSIHSPAISAAMDSASLYPQSQQAYSPAEYGALPPIDGVNHQSSPAPSSTAYSPYPNHSTNNLYNSSTTDTAYTGSHSISSHHQHQPPPDPSSRATPLHASNSIRASVSTPNTPLSYRTHPPPQGSQYYPTSLDPSQGPPPPRRRPAGLKRVREVRDLRPIVNPQPPGRRADPSSHGFLSPLKSLSTNLANTYNICNPQFRYETAHNPRRVLTKPSKPVHNDGFDNEDYDYILYVNDWLGAEDGQNKYLILDVLGQGTFGQVVKCQNMKTHEIVAVKVVKNKPAYFNQSMMEVTILELLNGTWDPHDEHHILRLRDTFIHKSHLCLVFELLSSNLYELIKQNQFGGLSTQLVKVFTAQLLDALTVLNEARLIHCDLKPENILLKSLQSPQIKVIDFGSACHERQTVYTYIQSRFYRSPEVLLGMAYTSAIDMWSLGCIAVELFLGLPLFPGTSEYNQITRIVEMLGQPPTYMLDIGKQTSNFFTSYLDEYGRKKYRLKSLEQYSKEHGTNEQPGKKYFSANTLPDIVRNAPVQKAGSKVGDVDREMQHRAAFIDFVQGLLNLDPIQRWSPQQAKLHPFITGEKFTKPYVPAGSNGRSSSMSSHSSQATLVGHTHQPAAPTNSLPGADAKRPYGGLVPQPTKGARAYQDAATYNQHLAQHQAYTAQAATAQATNNAFRNPYAAAAAAVSQNNAAYGATPQQQNATSYPPPLQNAHTSGTYATAPSNPPGYGTGPPSYPPARSDSLTSSTTQYTQAQPPPPQHAPHPPTNSYYPQSRARSNTINQMDQVPPSLARIANQHNLDLESAAAGGRNTLTPVINHREEAMREWERNKHTGGAPAAGASKAYQQLEYLQQQAEAGAWNYPGGGSGAHASHAPHTHALGYGSTTHSRYAPAQPSSLQFQSPPVALVVDTHDKSMGGMRDVVMSSARSAAGLPPSNASVRYDAPGPNVPVPPQPAYVGAGSSGRYGPPSATQPAPSSITYSQGQQPHSPSLPPQPPTAPAGLYDSYDARDGMGTLYVPMQPHQFQSTYQNSPGGGGGGTLSSQGTQPISGATFYGSGVVPSGNSLPPIQAQQQQQQGKDGRRMSGMDLWPR